MTEPETDEYDANLYRRTIAKLMLNSLPGRLNLNINRKQTMLTRNTADLVPIFADEERYKLRELQELKIGAQSVLKAVYTEGDYDYHVQQFDVAPHLSAYMLGYSKMLMASHFKFIRDIGATPLYTDTDSIKILFENQTQVKLYTDQFVPTVKTFGGMECEDEHGYTELLTCGPKNAAYKHADGGYSWFGNGIRARENVELDIWEAYKEVIYGGMVTVNDFSICSTADLNLTHTTDATKKLRFICTKGPVTGEGSETRIGMWKDVRQFEEYCAGIVPMGLAETWARLKMSEKLPRYSRCPQKGIAKASQKFKDELKAWQQSLPGPQNGDVRRLDNVLSETLPDTDGLGQMTARQLYPAIQDAMGVTELSTEMKTRVKEQACNLLATGDIQPAKRRRTVCNTVVYMLRAQDGVDIGYIGSANDVEERLRKHNGELAGGARQTVGRTWQIHCDR